MAPDRLEVAVSPRPVDRGGFRFLGLGLRAASLVHVDHPTEGGGGAEDSGTAHLFATRLARGWAGGGGGMRLETWPRLGWDYGGSRTRWVSWALGNSLGARRSEMAGRRIREVGPTPSSRLMGRSSGDRLDSVGGAGFFQCVDWINPSRPTRSTPRPRPVAAAASWRSSRSQAAERSRIRRMPPEGPREPIISTSRPHESPLSDPPAGCLRAAVCEPPHTSSP